MTKSAYSKPLLIATILFTVPIQAQILVDRSFQANLTGGGTVNSVVVDDSGKILFGGSFPQVNGQARESLCRVFFNGTLDANFEASASGLVRVIQFNDAGEIIVGGSFSSVNGQTWPNLARLLTDGGLDTTFQATTYGGIHSVASLNDEVIVGGGFSAVNGNACVYVARLDSLGGLAGSYSSAISPSLAMETGVYVVAVQSDGKILAGGNFETAHGFDTLTRLNADGSLDSSFSLNNGPILYPRSIIVLPNGKILVSGSANPHGEGFVRRLNSDGTVDETFQAPSFYGFVNTIAVDPSGKIVAGGNFTVAGSGWKSLARLNADGTLDSSFDISANNVVNTIAFQADGKMLVGGAFTSIGGVEQAGIARLEEETFTFHSSSNAGGQFVAKLQAEPGKTYVIESSADLKSWNTFSTNTASEAGLQVTTTTDADEGRRFFRAKLQQ